MLIHSNQDSLRIGVLSDTHGLFRPELPEIFSHVDYLLHAGDIGGRETLTRLETIAPVLAVRGNTDNSAWFQELSDTAIFETARVRLYMLHNIDELDFDPGVAGYSAIIFGHSHQASIEWKKNILYFNPGSAGPKRFRLQASAGVLTIDSTKITPEILQF